MKTIHLQITHITANPLPGSELGDCHKEAANMAKTIECDVSYTLNDTCYRIPNPNTF